MIFRLAEKTFFLSACCSPTLCVSVRSFPENGVAMHLRGPFFLYLRCFAVLKRNDRLSCESCFMLTLPFSYQRKLCLFVVFRERLEPLVVVKLSVP